MVADSASATIPSIDFTHLANNKAEISKQLISAAIDVGFFHVTGKQRHNTAWQQHLGQEMLSVQESTAGHGLLQDQVDTAFSLAIRSAQSSCHLLFMIECSRVRKAGFVSLWSVISD